MRRGARGVGNRKRGEEGRRYRRERRERREASSCSVLVVPEILKPQTVTADPY